MSQRSDAELVRAYVGQGSQEAFAELVARYVDLVYTSAVRQVKDRHGAEDVAQAAFMVLARKARGLRPDSVLGAWLLGVTRYAARDWKKAQARRHRHEEAAARQRIQEMDAGSSATSSAFPDDLGRHANSIDEVLDEALSRLGAGGRQAVVLRFFQDKSFKEVGEQLGISEEAARQRVFRSLDRLRQLLGRQAGVQLAADGLALMLVTCAVRPAPAHLAVTITSSVMKGAAAAATPAALAKGAITLMAWTKAKTALIGAAALLLLGGAGATVVHYATRDRDETVAIKNIPAPAARAAAGQVVYTWWGPPPTATSSYHGAPIVGYAKTSDGRPVANATVYLSSRARGAWAYDTNGRNTNGGLVSAVTAADGRFELAPREEPLGVMVSSNEGFGAAAATAAKQVDVIVMPWGRIEGVAKIATRPVANAMVQIAQFGNDAADQLNIVRQTQAHTDPDGHFTLARAVPGRTHIGCQSDKRIYIAHWGMFDIKSGQTTLVQLGGTGRAVIGHTDAPVDAYSYRSVRAYNTVQPNTENQFEAVLNTDGTFRIEDVPPGQYSVQLQCGFSDPGSAFVEDAAFGNTQFIVAPIPSGRSDEPLDIGAVKLTIRPRFMPGDDTPDIAGKDASGATVKLSDFRGKIVLLHLWSSQREDQITELNALKAVYDRFGDDDRVALLGMFIDVTEAKGREWAAQNHLEWPQGYTGNWSQTNPPQKLATSPANIFVIDPQGKLIAKYMTAHEAYGAIERFLAKGEKQ